MEFETLELEPRLQQMVDMGSSGTDILHGELKNMMLEAEQHLDMCVAREEESGEAMDSMDRTYAEGWLEALSAVYYMTYQLAFAITERTKARG